MINLVIEKIRNIKAKSLSFENNYIEFSLLSQKKTSVNKVSEIQFFFNCNI